MKNDKKQETNTSRNHIYRHSKWCYPNARLSSQVLIKFLWILYLALTFSPENSHGKQIRFRYRIWKSCHFWRIHNARSGVYLPAHYRHLRGWRPRKSLDVVMAERGHITSEQRGCLLKTLGITIVFCPHCKKEFKNRCRSSGSHVLQILWQKFWISKY